MSYLQNFLSHEELHMFFVNLDMSCTILGYNLISVLVFTSHIHLYIALILLCLAVPFFTSPGCFYLLLLYTTIFNNDFPSDDLQF